MFRLGYRCYTVGSEPGPCSCLSSEDDRLPVIEYTLLFGLGFMTAILAALLLAPSIHHRIVRFTEDRLKATLPFTPQEVRAQKDMVRAEMATQLAKTGQYLAQERHKAAAFQIRNEQLVEEAGRLYGRNQDLERQIEEKAGEAAELRSLLRAGEIEVEGIRLSLAEAAREDRAKQGRIDTLDTRIRQLLGDIDNLRIDLAARDTEIENLNARNNALRDERDNARSDLKLTIQRAKDAELRLAREENRAQRLEDRLNREIAGSADLETAIERRINEIARLKERLKEANAEARESARLLKASGIARPQLARVRTGSGSTAVASPSMAVLPSAGETGSDAVDEGGLIARLHELSDVQAAMMAEDARNRMAVLSERLINTPHGSRDEELRAEIADIAARMIAITAHREGPASPIRPIIARAIPAGTSRVSLAERANRLLKPGAKV